MGSLDKMKNIKKMNARDLIHSEEFIREPVNDICKKIQNINFEKMILGDGRGNGKSTVLQQLQNRTIDTDKPFICMQFDAAGLPIKENDIFTQEFLIHYLEERFANQLLYYIRNNYERTYYNNFREYSAFIEESSRKTIDFINNSSFGNTKPLDKLLHSKEISGEILEKFKSILSTKNIGLCIDRFDWINNSDALTQHILSDYFNLFRNVIITSDDENLVEEWKLKPFTPEKYDFSYTKNITTVRLILSKRIEIYNRESRRNEKDFVSFPLDWLDVDTIDLLIKETNGNISEMLEILNSLVQIWHVKETITEDIINQAIEDTKGHARQLKQMASPIKFHLKV